MFSIVVRDFLFPTVSACHKGLAFLTSLLRLTV
nr:MAG TPA: hypothetical protein [Caudoviricetes sp.]